MKLFDLISYCLCALILLICINDSEAWDQCEVARQLSSHGFGRDELADWTCLVMSESSGDFSVIGGPNTDGSRDWGLFQINDRYWCGVGWAGKECNADCYAFLNDDISDDVQCARKIQGIHGLDAWYGWQAKCKGGPPSVDHCF
ncbi:lysozyme-like [Chrysoperla carnea]|uniref:lysozyme-like n=1 Tax=Chrysoperla carnea TaxID=189513 RepID=UPI001D09597E|nr:lysozyme-like [Chrysoperla carnea]